MNEHQVACIVADLGGLPLSIQCCLGHHKGQNPSVAFFAEGILSEGGS